MELSLADIQNYNTKTLDNMDDPIGRQKIASIYGTYTRDRLREECAVDKILPPRDITPQDCQVSLNHDTLVRIEYMEPESPGAMTITYRGIPEARWIRAPRYAIPFYMIASRMVEKNEEELMAYRDVPLTKIVEDQIVKDMQEIKDRTTLLHFETAVQEMQRLANGGTVTALLTSTYATAIKVSVLKGKNTVLRGLDDFQINPIIKPDIVEMRKLLASYRPGTTALNGRLGRLKLSQILISVPDFEDVNNWTLQDMGDRVTSETVENGWKQPVLIGVKYIATAKVDIFKPGNVWGFTEPEFIGKSFILQRAKFYVDKVMNVIKWASWMHVGVGIGNVSSIIKLELYGGNVAPGTAGNAKTAGFEVVEPLAEKDLFKNNNKVDLGSTAGTVSQY